MKLKKITTPQLRNSINPLPWRYGFFLIALACFALSSTSQAVLDADGNPPDGDFGNGNTAEGKDALFSLTTGANNTAIGSQALYSNTTGNGNTANGDLALYFNTTGVGNTADGYAALFSNTTGASNTATGLQALQNNTTGNYNLAEGTNALSRNTTGISNTANGNQALFSNTTANYNTATGDSALYSNTKGASNTATGAYALNSNTTGGRNVANGIQALQSNTTGNFNTATGAFALFNNTTGVANTSYGSGSLGSNTTGIGNTAIGVDALNSNTTGNHNIAIGSPTSPALGAPGGGGNLTTGSNNIDIGNFGVAGESNTIRIGDGQNATFIAGISGTAVAGVSVVVDGNGQLGVLGSSRRFKDEIKPMEKSSEAILALKPVTFRYKHELDPNGIPQFGLVAEEVEKVNRDLVARDAEGKVYTVRYEAVNAMLLNEFLKQHRKVQELESTVAQQQKGMEVLAASLKEHAVQIQNVSDRLERSKPAPQMVNNNQ